VDPIEHLWIGSGKFLGGHRMLRSATHPATKAFHGGVCSVIRPGLVKCIALYLVDCRPAKIQMRRRLPAVMVSRPAGASQLSRRAAGTSRGTMAVTMRRPLRRSSPHGSSNYFHRLSAAKAARWARGLRCGLASSHMTRLSQQLSGSKTRQLMWGASITVTSDFCESMLF
jgi:hypothetical protein